MKAIWINAQARTIALVEYNGLPDLQKMVGGHIELGPYWENGDVCYVDEEGKLKDYSFGFVIPGFRDVYIGNGVIVGRETDPEDTVTADPVITPAQLLRVVRFLAPVA